MRPSARTSTVVVVAVELLAVVAAIASFLPMAVIIFVVVLLLAAGAAAAPRALDYRRRWLEAVALLTASDEARDQARMRGDNFAGIASDRQRRVRELEAQIGGWQAAAGEVDGAIDALLTQANKEGYTAGWAAREAHAKLEVRDEREEQGRQQALRRLLDT